MTRPCTSETDLPATTDAAHDRESHQPEIATNVSVTTGGQGSVATAANPAVDAQRHHTLNPTPTPQTTGKKGVTAGTGGKR
jgi:hypothetical protein